MLLVAVDLLASRYDVNDLISIIWEERLQAGNSQEIFHLLCSIARGYRSECQSLLSYISSIKSRDDICIFERYQYATRSICTNLHSQQVSNEVYGGDLDSEHYYNEMAERELELNIPMILISTARDITSTRNIYLMVGAK